jgi:hypothetical protein
MSARILISLSEIKEARTLLYEVYCKNGGWYPPKNNPINHRIEDGQLMDDYDFKHTWYGYFDESNKLVGCARASLNSIKDRKKLELFQYATTPVHIMNYRPDDLMVEINRTCFSPKYRGSKCYLEIYTILLKDIYKFDQSAFFISTIEFEKFLSFLVKLGAKIIGKVKYYPEENECSIIVGNVSYYSTLSKIKEQKVLMSKL